MKDCGGVESIKKILVVEDEPRVAEVCHRVLSREGFAVQVAVNGVAAQDMVWATDYDLCLVDIRTPIMSGKEFFQYLTEKNPELAQRVIFTTGDVISSDTRHFLEQTGRPFLLKPFTPDELKTIVMETLSRLRWPTEI